MRVFYYQNRIEILLHDEEIDRLHKSSVNKVIEPLTLKDFSPNDSRALIIRRDDYQPKIDDRFKMHEKERHAIWMLTKENERMNRETKSDDIKETKPKEDIKAARMPDSKTYRWPPNKR